MNVGMLWFDNDPHTPLTAKIARAADYYWRKYGLVPNLCLVNPSILSEVGPSPVESRAGQVTVRPNRVILPGHLWIGTEEKDLASSEQGGIRSS